VRWFISAHKQMYSEQRISSSRYWNYFLFYERLQGVCSIGPQRCLLTDSTWQWLYREICTINITKGLYQLTRPPKGMKNSSAIFQKVITHQDNVLIHAPSKDVLAWRMSSVLKRLEEKYVTMLKISWSSQRKCTSLVIFSLRKVWNQIHNLWWILSA